MYNIGEQIVVRTNFKIGVVVSLNEQKETAEIRYEDGSNNWVSISDITKLLLETDPKPNTELL